MEIFNFNMSDNKEDVIDALIDVYYNNPELFEDEAYCHFDVDDLTGNIYVFNNTREAEYGCACDYILDDDDNIPKEDIRDCVEYFYNEMVDKAEERTSMAKRNGNFIYGESKNRLRIRDKLVNESNKKTRVVWVDLSPELEDGSRKTLSQEEICSCKDTGTAMLIIKALRDNSIYGRNENKNTAKPNEHMYLLSTI